MLLQIVILIIMECVSNPTATNVFQNIYKTIYFNELMSFFQVLTCIGLYYELRSIFL